MSLYPYQKKVFKEVAQGKSGVIVIHRRAGKDVTCVQLWLLRALQRVGTHIYLFPLVRQAREVIWNGMMFNGKAFLSVIPPELIAKKNEARMEITLINGSRMVLGGSNLFDAWMGSNPCTIIYSEFALHNPQARQYLNPILVQNGGVEIIQSTPRGLNHLYELLQVVMENDKYFSYVLTVDDTKDNEGNPIINNEMIENARKMGMSEEKIRQEFYCDFFVGNMGSYFTSQMTDMANEGRLLRIPVHKNLPLHTAWDLGGTDSTACWIFQVDGQYINLLQLIVKHGEGLKYYLDLAEKIRVSYGCSWGQHFMPHDVKQKHQGWEQAESRLMQARKAGWFFTVTPKVDIEDGIEAMRFILPKTRINMPECDLGARALREYQREYDEANACYRQKPLHNWASDIVDAFRYLALNHKRLYQAPMPMSTYEYDG
ncbi:MAG: hypothetical protein QNK36_10455 [Colwellia sp.]|nr:hypothetical protein [Colwellia sp.]